MISAALRKLGMADSAGLSGNTTDSIENNPLSQRSVRSPHYRASQPEKATRPEEKGFVKRCVAHYREKNTMMMREP